MRHVEPTSPSLGGARRDWWRIAIPLVIAACAFIVRFAALEPMELYGDALIKWFFVKTWFLGNQYDSWNHHMTQFGVLVPALITQKALGTHPAVYSVAPLIFATLGVVYTYRVSELLAGPFAGLCALFVVIEVDVMARASSQLLSGGFTATYGIMAAFYVLRASDETGGRRATLVTVGAALAFGAYLTDVSALFFLPAFGIAIWQTTSDRSLVTRFFVVVLALYAIEHTAYAVFTAHPWGRLQVVAATQAQFDGGPTLALMERFSAMLESFANEDESWQMLFYPLPLVAAAVFTVSTTFRARYMVWLVACFVLGHLTFGNHVLTAMLIPLTPLAAVIYGTFVGRVLAPPGSVRLPTLLRFITWFNQRPSHTVFGVLCVTGYVLATGPFVGHKVVARAQRHFRLATEAYDSGIPIVGVVKKGNKYRRTLAMVGVPYAYLPDRVLPHDQLVHIPDHLTQARPEAMYQNVEVEGRTYATLTKEPQSEIGLAVLIARSCVFEVRHRAGRLHFDREELDGSCPVSPPAARR